MPRWTDAPPKGSDQPSFRIIRTPPQKTLTAIVTSTDILGCATHFVQNRTVPCEKDEDKGIPCQHCSDGHSWRWHGYVSAILTNSHEHILFEFTAPPSDTFRNYLLHTGSLRGCLFTARRPSGRPNGRVVVSCKSVDLTTLRLPAPPNIRNILCAIWNIRTNNASTTPSSRPPIKNIDVTPSKNDGRYRPQSKPRR